MKTVIYSEDSLGSCAEVIKGDSIITVQYYNDDKGGKLFAWHLVEGDNYITDKDNFSSLNDAVKDAESYLANK